MYVTKPFFKKDPMMTARVIILSVVLAILGCNTLPETSQVTLTHGVDDSAGGLSSYIVQISNATFFLEKQGGGLSSMLDKDGVDWIGFNNTKGSGWKGEYRGFPNAVHKQDGNYFHALNASTDISSSYVAINTSKHVQIIFTSSNKKWLAQWDFYPDRCDFSMTQVSQNHKYWVQYEGVPGGKMDKTDFWYNSASNQSHLIDQTFKGDLPAPEWFAFGDIKTPRMMFLLHHEDDQHPDDYVSRPYMTVLGFGRRGKAKFLTTPQTFSIGFVESSEYADVAKGMHNIIR